MNNNWSALKQQGGFHGIPVGQRMESVGSAADNTGHAQHASFIRARELVFEVSCMASSRTGSQSSSRDGLAKLVSVVMASCPARGRDQLCSCRRTATGAPSNNRTVSTALPAASECKLYSPPLTTLGTLNMHRSSVPASLFLKFPA